MRHGLEPSRSLPLSNAARWLPWRVKLQPKLASGLNEKSPTNFKHEASSMRFPPPCRASAQKRGLQPQRFRYWSYFVIALATSLDTPLRRCLASGQGTRYNTRCSCSRHSVRRKVDAMPRALRKTLVALYRCAPCQAGPLPLDRHIGRVRRRSSGRSARGKPSVRLCAMLKVTT